MCKWRKNSSAISSSKVEYNFKISSGIKTLPVDQVFLKLGYCYEKSPMFRSSNSKSLKRASVFFSLKFES